MTEHPTESYHDPIQPTAAPATYHPPTAAPASSATAATPDGHGWVPLLPARLAPLLVAIGLVVGIAGPILLWLNVETKTIGGFDQRIGWLLVVVGLGVVLIGLPLLLIDAMRPGSASGLARPDTVTAPPRGFSSSRLVALVGVLIMIIGAFLVEPADASGESGQDRDRGGRSEADGRGR